MAATVGKSLKSKNFLLNDLIDLLSDLIDLINDSLDLINDLIEKC